MPSYQCRKSRCGDKMICQYWKSHCGDKMVTWPSYLHNGIFCTGNITSIHWSGNVVILTKIFITGCTGSCQYDNFQWSQWWKFHENDNISIECILKWSPGSDGYKCCLASTKPHPKHTLQQSLLHNLIPCKFLPGHLSLIIHTVNNNQWIGS